MKRGEQWNGVEAEDGEPLGWHCDDCIADWKGGEGRDVYLRRLVPLADGFWSEDGLGAVMSDMAVI